MWPTFEIYLNILAGSWMPWLCRSKLSSRFEPLPGVPFGALTSHTTGSFFSTLVSRMQIYGEPAPEKVMQELNTLAGEKCSMRNSTVSEFLNLPASSRHEQFYNALTGFCLEGYTNWIYRFISNYQESEVAVYFRIRILNSLHHLIHIPLPTHDAGRQELEIVLRVKAALCVLYSRLKKEHGSYYGNIHQTCTAYDLLKSCLDESSLDIESCRQVIRLFENLSGEKHKSASVTEKTSRYDTHRELTSMVMEPGLGELTRLVKGVDSDINEVRQVLKKYILIQEEPVKNPSQESPRVLDSITVRKMLSIGKSSLQRYRNSGLLPFTKIGGKYTYLETDVINLINKGKNKK